MILHLFLRNLWADPRLACWRPQPNVPIWNVRDCYKLIHLYSFTLLLEIDFPSTAKFVKILIGQPNLTLQIQIPQPTQVMFKSPTLWKALRVICPIPKVQKKKNARGCFSIQISWRIIPKVSCSRSLGQYRRHQQSDCMRGYTEERRLFSSGEQLRNVVQRWAWLFCSIIKSSMIFHLKFC